MARTNCPKSPVRRIFLPVLSAKKWFIGELALDLRGFVPGDVFGLEIKMLAQVKTQEDQYAHAGGHQEIFHSACLTMEAIKG
jgi:hypothetical protein